MKKRTKIIILTVMIVLLGVTGYLNIVLNNSITEPTNTTTTTSYFVSYRNDRETSRDQQMLYLDAIIDNENSTEEAVQNAENQKLELIAEMEKELAVEGLIKALGFSDCVISIGEKINVVVDSSELTAGEVAQIKTTVMEQLGVEPKNIVVIPSV